jgi:hypothetical protein
MRSLRTYPHSFHIVVTHDVDLWMRHLRLNAVRGYATHDISPFVLNHFPWNVSAKNPVIVTYDYPPESPPPPNPNCKFFL